MEETEHAVRNTNMQSRGYAMNNRIRQLLAFAVCVALLAGCGGGAPAASPAPAATATPVATATAAPTPTPAPAPFQATIVDAINEVAAHALPDEDWRAAQVDMAVYEGGEVWAKEASTARVGVEENLVRVAPNTIFTLEQPDADTLRLNLQEGQAWINVEGLQPGQTFEVETPAAVASVRGTRFSARVAPDGTTLVSTWAATVTVSSPAGAVDVTAGLQTTIAQDEAPSVPAPMCPIEQARWGMAAGPGLDVALPVLSATNVLSYPYSISYPGMSSGGDYFAGIYNVPLEENSYRPEPLSYDLQAARISTATLPGNASYVAFNPTGEGLVYELHGHICPANDDWTGAACFGQGYDHPLWSPDGQWLLFTSYTSAGSNLFKARLDGSDLTQLTSNQTGYNSSAAWSPDGSRIAYTFYTDYEQPAELRVMNADGSNQRQVLPQVGYGAPLWSRDSSYLVVSGYGEGEYGQSGGLWFVPLDGSDSWQAPGSAGWSCWNPTWSPTATGWPLFFHGYGAQSGADSGHSKPGSSTFSKGLQGYGVEGGRYGGPGAGGGLSGIWWLSQDSDAPTYFSSADWGPVWGGDRVAFGYVQGESGENRQTTVYFYQTEPAFWP
jgi:hypothetical protein